MTSIWVVIADIVVVIIGIVLLFIVWTLFYSTDTVVHAHGYTHVLAEIGISVRSVVLSYSSYLTQLVA
jgi:type II secretory pathway pseudopilin PulG